MFEFVELLSKVNVKLFRLLSPIVKENGVTITELIILWRINRKGPTRITDIAREAGVPASTLTGVFDRLEAQGYLERIHDREDRRSVLVSGTPKLREMIGSAIQRADADLDEMFASLPPGLVDRLAEDLARLYSHLNKEESDRKNERTDR